MESDLALVDRWRTLLTSYNRVAAQLERALQDEHGLTLSDFETLDRLATGDCDKRRMLDLAHAMYLSQSAISRTVARLERQGLVERTHCADDRRGVFVQLTAMGVTRHIAADRTRLDILAEHLGTT